ncbi:MAG: hypothetical protein ABIK28_14060, partial [Planctomycetota bacterium]
LPYLHGPDFPETIFNKQGILDLIRAHDEKRTDVSHLLGTLLTLAVFSDLCAQWARTDPLHG